MFDMLSGSIGFGLGMVASGIILLIYAKFGRKQEA